MTDNAYGFADQLVTCSRSTRVELAAVLPASGVFLVARLEATRMTDADHVFYEFSDALRFLATSAGTGTRCQTASAI